LYLENPDGTEGEIHFINKNLDGKLYANFLVALSNPLNHDVYEFLKLMIEGTRLIKQNTKQGRDCAVRIEKYLDNKILNKKQ
jgi:hypothetical protein